MVQRMALTKTIPPNTKVATQAGFLTYLEESNAPCSSTMKDIYAFEELSLHYKGPENSMPWREALGPTD